MKKLLITFVVFISLILNLAYAENLNEYSLDDFVCNYYEQTLEQVDDLMSENMFYEAEEPLEKLYNSKCKTPDVAKRYLMVLRKNRKFSEAYEIAKDNKLLDTYEGLLLQAEMSIKIKDSTQARSFYDNILIKTPYDKSAQLTLNQSYISTSSDLSALTILKKIEEDDDIKLLKAKAFYNLEMFENSYDLLDELPESDNIINLKNEIKRKRAYDIVLGYELYDQELDEEFELDVKKFAITNSAYYKNMQVYFDYILYLYKSGQIKNIGVQNNTTNEVRIGTQGRLNEKIALRTDVALKAFQDAGLILLSDNWLKYHFSDKFNMKLGFQRRHIEQTYLSAVGLNIDNVFTGQVVDNNLYLDTTFRIPKESYIFTKAGIGYRDGQNLDNNLYWEGMAGVGKLFRYDLSRPYLQKISLDLVSFNSGFQQNQQRIVDSQGIAYGGYFSPTFYSDNTLNYNFFGRIKNKFSYGVGGYIGWQFARMPDQSLLIYGGSFYGKYRANDYLSAELQYRYYRYANINRNQLIFNLVISLFRKEKKS